MSCVVLLCVGAGLPAEALMAHPYFSDHGLTPQKLWTKRPFGLSGPTDLSGPFQVQQTQVRNTPQTSIRALHGK